MQHQIVRFELLHSSPVWGDNGIQQTHTPEEWQMVHNIYQDHQRGVSKSKSMWACLFHFTVLDAYTYFILAQTVVG